MAFCGQCGTQLEDGMLFCPSCGAKVGAPNNAPTNNQATNASANNQPSFSTEKIGETFKNLKS